MKGERNRILAAAAIAAAAMFVSLAPAQEELSPEEFDRLSLQYRTALHYDPLLDAPLDSLVRLYRETERTDELIGLYRSHIEQYPEDAGAKTVLIRALRKIDRTGADELIASAVPLHKDYAPLQYVYFTYLQEKGDPRSVEALVRAIELEANPARRRIWLDELLELSDDEISRSVAAAQLERLLAEENQTSAALLDMAKLMQRYRFWELSLRAINRAKSVGLAAEAEVDAEIMAAQAQAELGNRQDAARMLDALLGKLSPDFWRRREVLSLRVSVVTTEAEREALLKRLRESQEKNPTDETRLLDYVEVLVAGERQSEALDILVANAAKMPKSSRIETRALELLEASADYESYKAFLEQRLEIEPQRNDLRFKLVKVDYALGKDAEAEQEFKAVVAGLPTEEASARIMELQRFLRSIDRVEAAGRYLEHYVRNHPSRLDVARELLESYVVSGNRPAVDGIVEKLDVSEAAVENISDLSEFLIAEGLFGAAKHILTSKLASDPNQFELGILLVEVLGELGDLSNGEKLIGRLRDMTDTPARYRVWLETAVDAHRKFETLDRFFDAEQNRFNFSDGAWAEDKIEKFLLFGEVARRQMLTDKVAQGVRDQLKQTGIKADLRLRLRRFLVGLLEQDMAFGVEVEEQLNTLAKEDPERALDYDLRRGLLYDRSQRVDVAGLVLASVDYAQVDSAELLREAVPVLLRYGYLKEASAALASINRIEPEDLFSWEKRLSVLAGSNQEQSFRSVIRTLRNEESGVDLRDSSRQALTEHLIASYWRSIARILVQETGMLGESLPLLASVEREENGPLTHLWTEWCRSYVLARMGQEAESLAALRRFRKLADDAKLSEVTFPDGLALSTEAASGLIKRLMDGVPPAVESDDAEFLYTAPKFTWAFEVDPGSLLVDFARSADRVVVLDSAGTVYAVDPATGKLLWRRHFGSGSRLASTSSLFPFQGAPFATVPEQAGISPQRTGEAASGFAVSGGRVFSLGRGDLRAYGVENGELEWKAKLPFVGAADSGDQPLAGSKPGLSLKVSGAIAVVFDAASGETAGFEGGSGKLLWNTKVESSEDDRSLRLFSLNSGLSVSDTMVFVYGDRPAILNLATGTPVWRFDRTSTARFPIVLRMDRGETEEPEIEFSSLAEGDEADWQQVAVGQPAEVAPSVIDFAGIDFGDTVLLSDTVGESATLAGPAVHWAEVRSAERGPAVGEIFRGALYLMQSGSVRRVSASMPVASRELPAEGAFLGATGNHAWFYDDDGYLYHADFHRNTGSRVSVRDLGPPAHVRGVLLGNQLVIRGRAGVVVVNALTGRVVSRALWPEDLLRYLSNHIADSPGLVTEMVWQGRIVRQSPGQPGYCFPVTDLIEEGQYLTAFGQRSLVCLEAAPAPPRETALRTE